MTDPRAAVEFRVPAGKLQKGDLVNISPGEDDWQEVVGVFITPEDARSEEITTLVATVVDRYVVVQLTDLAPVDGQVYFRDGAPMVYGDGEDEDDDRPLEDVVSHQDGLRTYLFTKYELVAVRTA